MGRRKKESFVENVTPMQDDALNAPVEAVEEKPLEVIEEKPVEVVKDNDIPVVPYAKRISSPSSLVNVREKPDGEVLYRLNNGQKIMVEEEKDGWCKIVAYVMSELVGEP